MNLLNLVMSQLWFDRKWPHSDKNIIGRKRDIASIKLYEEIWLYIFFSFTLFLIYRCIKQIIVFNFVDGQNKGSILY